MAFSEVLVVLGSLLWGWEIALTAVQVLWINLITDGFPYMALTVDPKDKRVLKRKPVKSSSALVDRKLLIMIGVMSLLTAGLALVTYIWWFPLGISVGQTGAFVVISLGTLGYVFSCRSLSEPIWIEKPWGNMYLVGAVLVGVLLTVAGVSAKWLQDLLLTVDLNGWQWLWAFGCAVIILVGAEIMKWLLNRKEGKL
jgi:P-type Ca2+ transporter type 2C